MGAPRAQRRGDNVEKHARQAHEAFGRSRTSSKAACACATVIVARQWRTLSASHEQGGVGPPPQRQGWERTRARGVHGPQLVGLVGPNRAMTGTPTAAAMCIGAVSTPK